jgi:hypothetical protein
VVAPRNRTRHRFTFLLHSGTDGRSCQIAPRTNRLTIDTTHTIDTNCNQITMDEQQSSLLLKAVACELEALRRSPSQAGAVGVPCCSRMPAACQRLMMSLPGNAACVDCGSPNPEWASVSYGALLCLMCSGRHRGYGVHTSFVRSVRMDSWSHAHVLAMLEGGNGQLRGFFDRHQLLDGRSSASAKRYHTKAAQFYREHLRLHVQNVSASGEYAGREAHRQSCKPSPRLESQRKCSNQVQCSSSPGSQQISTTAQ